jgi:hypothetical protein
MLLLLLGCAVAADDWENTMTLVQVRLLLLLLPPFSILFTLHAA